MDPDLCTPMLLAFVMQSSFLWGLSACIIRNKVVYHHKCPWLTVLQGCNYTDVGTGAAHYTTPTYHTYFVSVSYFAYEHTFCLVKQHPPYYNNEILAWTAKRCPPSSKKSWKASGWWMSPCHGLYTRHESTPIYIRTFMAIQYVLS
jgi:hypothetical protein